MASPDYIIDIEGVAQHGVPASHVRSAAAQGKPWLAILWRCCHVYSRVYRNALETAYEGRCPRCAKKIRVGIAQSGTSTRFFEAG